MHEDEAPRGEWGRRWGSGQLALFLRPAILLLIRQGPAHGYTLIEDLRREGLIDADLDPEVVYLYMREMEEERLLVSEWDTTGGSVPGQVYHSARRCCSTRRPPN